MEEERTCPDCGTKLFHNVNKISKKTGKPYTNWNCPKCDFVEFVDTNKIVAQTMNTAKEDEGFFEKVANLVDEERKLRG